MTGSIVQSVRLRLIHFCSISIGKLPILRTIHIEQTFEREACDFLHATGIFNSTLFTMSNFLAILTKKLLEAKIFS